MAASTILFYVLCPIAFVLCCLALFRDGRRLIVHCVQVLLNGKSPLRWLAGLLAGILPPVCWTMAFKLARNIPDDWRPEIHTHFLPVLEAFMLSPGGVVGLTILLSPLAYFIRLRNKANSQGLARLYPILVLCFPLWLKVLNFMALTFTWSDSQDVIAWIFYGVLHFASPFIAGWWIWGFGPPGAAIVFGITLGVQNFTGLCTHIIFPTAAPWFYDEHPDWETLLVDYSFPGSSAGLVRVDKVLHTHLYQAAFKKSPVVFGALPSLHAATAMCCSFYVARYGGKWGHIAMFIYSSAMLWSTQYLHHHWAADLLMGSALSLAAFTIATRALRVLEAKHEQEATTRGVDRLFCWPSPHASRYQLLPTFRENVVFEHAEDGESGSKRPQQQRSTSKAGGGGGRAAAWAASQYDVESLSPTRDDEEKAEWLELKKDVRRGSAFSGPSSSSSTDSLPLPSPSSASSGGSNSSASRR